MPKIMNRLGANVKFSDSSAIYAWCCVFLAWARRAFKGFSTINARAETPSPPTLAIAFQQLA
jgi:hypothetical protein